jgi:hypothetical protein
MVLYSSIYMNQLIEMEINIVCDLKKRRNGKTYTHRKDKQRAGVG